jgi:hypothetical protein
LKNEVDWLAFHLLCRVTVWLLHSSKISPKIYTTRCPVRGKKNFDLIFLSYSMVVSHYLDLCKPEWGIDTQITKWIVHYVEDFEKKNYKTINPNWRNIIHTWLYIKIIFLLFMRHFKFKILKTRLFWNLRSINRWSLTGH